MQAAHRRIAEGFGIAAQEGIEIVAATRNGPLERRDRLRNAVQRDFRSAEHSGKRLGVGWNTPQALTDQRLVAAHLVVIHQHGKGLLFQVRSAAIPEQGCLMAGIEHRRRIASQHFPCMAEGDGASVRPAQISVMATGTRYLSRPLSRGSKNSIRPRSDLAG